MPSKSQGFTFYLEMPAQVILTPQKQNVINNFDHMGDFIGLKRIDGESAVDYRNRLFDVRVHPANPTYTGVLNGLARDLGITREPAMTIELKLNSAGESIAPNPRVNILANKVVLYKDWRPNGTSVIDSTIRFYKQEDPGYLLSDLIALINQSECFSCTIDSNARPNMPSTHLLRGTTDFILQTDLVEGHHYAKLSFGSLVQDSIAFSETEIFKTEVFGTPSAEGEYKIDYENGSVQSFLLPSGKGTISYHAYRFPMKVDYLPIELYTFQDENFQEELYYQMELDSGENTNYLLNTEGSEIYHQLFLENKMFWGR